MPDNDQQVFLKNDQEGREEFNVLEYLGPIFRSRWESVLIVLAALIVGIIYNHFEFE